MINPVCVSFKPIKHTEYILHCFVCLNKISRNRTFQSADVSDTKQRGDTKLPAAQRQQMQHI
jgi:hypothetical protein